MSVHEEKEGLDTADAKDQIVKHNRSVQDKLRPEFEAVAQALEMVTIKTDPLYSRVRDVLNRLSMLASG